MKIYNVINSDKGYNEEFYSLKSAKAAMKENDAQGYITEIRSNGDWISHGQIVLSGSNKTFTANTKQTKAGY